MNLFNLFSSNKGTSLTYPVTVLNLGSVDQVIKSLTKVGYTCTVDKSNPVLYIISMKHPRKLTLDEILHTGSMIGMIEMTDKIK